MIGLSALGVYRSDVQVLPAISENSYENIFRVYATENTNQSNQVYFNLLNSVYLPNPLTPNTYYTITLNRSTPWTVISFDEYRTMDLWWLIALANNIFNPTTMPPAGTTLRIIKPQFVSIILDSINTQLKQ